MLSQSLVEAEKVFLADTFPALLSGDGKTIHFIEDCWMRKGTRRTENVSAWANLNVCSECENFSYSDMESELRDFKRALKRIIDLEEGSEQANLKYVGELTANCNMYKNDYFHDIYDVRKYLSEASIVALQDLAVCAMEALAKLFTRPWEASDTTWVALPLNYLKTFSKLGEPHPANQFFDQEIGRIRALSSTHALFAGPTAFDIAGIPRNLVAFVDTAPTSEVIHAMTAFLEDGMEFPDATKMAYSI